jgi:ATPase subunit of ABC transporter with duplicated ATPase domains
LVLALKEYDGAVVVVTHDRFFMRYVFDASTSLAAPEDITLTHPLTGTSK